MVSLPSLFKSNIKNSEVNYRPGVTAYNLDILSSLYVTALHLDQVLLAWHMFCQQSLCSQMFLPMLYYLKNLLQACEKADRISTFLCCSLLENAEPCLSVFICVYQCCSMAVLFINWRLFICLQIGLSIYLSFCLSICHCV